MTKADRSDIDALAADAYALQNSGDIAGVIEAYRKLLSVAPERPDDWYNLGYFQKRARQYEDALASYEAALLHDIRGPEDVFLNRAVVYADALRRPEDASLELEKAVAANPDYVPAWLNLGNLHEDRGARSEALQAYNKALEIEPGNALALARVADVSEIECADAPIVGRLKAALASRGLTEMDKADIGFALGRLLDSAGEFDGAFAAYSDANTASQNAGGQRYSRQATEDMMREIAEVFSEAVPVQATEAPSPIFICGMFRSGSSLLERIFAAHSKVTAGGELEIVPALVAQQLNPYPRSLLNADDRIYEKLKDHYCDELQRMGLQPAFTTDKRPDNFLHIGLIKRIFPNSKIIHSVRNPLDNCLSVFFAHLDPRMTYAQSLESAAHWHFEYERLMAHWKRLYPNDIHDVFYDELVVDPKPEIKGMLNFCGLEWEDACLSPHSVTGVVRTASSWQVRKPLYQKSSGRYRNYRCHIRDLVRLLGETKP